jgi:hypothetical protein
VTGFGGGIANSCALLEAHHLNHFKQSYNDVGPFLKF